MIAYTAFIKIICKDAIKKVLKLYEFGSHVTFCDEPMSQFEDANCFI